jgi:hypothetical protein
MDLPALSPFSPLGSILGDIQRTIQARLYYPALLVTLTIPEICSALLLDNQVLVKNKHYISFLDKYSSEKELGLGAVDCYRLRGGVVHRGNMVGHPKFDATHVVFTLPESRVRVQGVTLAPGASRVVMLDLLRFCQAMDTAARRWFDDNKANPKAVENMQNLIRYIPNATIPFIGNIPVVASGP